MKQAVLLTSLFLIFSFGVYAAEPLVTQAVSYCDVSYKKELIRPVNPATTRAIDAFNKTEDAIIDNRAYPFDIKLSPHDTHYFALACDSGPSNDPNCIFGNPQCAWWTKNGINDAACKDAEYLSGLKFIVPGDGCVYVSGHTNNMMDEHRKYCLVKGKLMEIKQPFMVSGLESKALRSLVLYDDMNLTHEIARIQKDDPVKVILMSDKDIRDLIKAHPQYTDYSYKLFLLQDQYGIAGWSPISESGLEAHDIEGIFYNGD